MQKDHTLSHNKIQSTLTGLNIEPREDIVAKIFEAATDYRQTAKTNRYLSKEATQKLKDIINAGNKYRTLLQSVKEDLELKELYWNTQGMQETTERIDRAIEDIRWIELMCWRSPQTKPRELRNSLFVANMIPIYENATGETARRPHTERFSETTVTITGAFFDFVTAFLTQMEPVEDTTIAAAIDRVLKDIKALIPIGAPVKHIII